MDMPRYQVAIETKRKKKGKRKGVLRFYAKRVKENKAKRGTLESF